MCVCVRVYMTYIPMVYIHTLHVCMYIIIYNKCYTYIHTYILPVLRDLGLSMAIFSNHMSPKLRDVSKMTAEWLHNRCYMQKEASLSFYHVCCSTFQLFFSKKNIFSSYYNTIMIFFLWKFLGEIHFQNIFSSAKSLIWRLRK